MERQFCLLPISRRELRSAGNSFDERNGSRRGDAHDVTTRNRCFRHLPLIDCPPVTTERSTLVGADSKGMLFKYCVESRGNANVPERPIRATRERIEKERVGTNSSIES
jgi:hypothetical protein